MSQIEIYQTDDYTIEVRLDASQDTVWFNQAQLLFPKVETIGTDYGY